MASNEGVETMKTKKAVALTTAKLNTNQIEIYQKRENQSSSILKDLLGLLLLRLVSGQAEPEAWQRFDRHLRRYYSASGVGFHGLQSTNSAQGVSE
jgi:hypothetical protein